MSEAKHQFTTNYPQWRTVKLRTAFKIGQLNYAPDGQCVISPVDPILASVSRSREWCEENRPRVGGYMVQGDGWQYHEAADFERGYVAMPALATPTIDSDLPPHQMRVLQELNEVSGRLAKLVEFTGTELFASLDEQERDRLNRQANAMGDYVAVLGERVAAF